MRKVDNGEKKRKEKKEKEKNVVFSGHYVIASSRPPERRTLVPKNGSVHLNNLKRKLSKISGGTD